LLLAIPRAPEFCCHCDTLVRSTVVGIYDDTIQRLAATPNRSEDVQLARRQVSSASEAAEVEVTPSLQRTHPVCRTHGYDQPPWSPPVAFRRPFAVTDNVQSAIYFDPSLLSYVPRKIAIPHLVL
jgi:hypothetical protein